MRYSIDDGPGPLAKDQVENYVGILKLVPVTADDTTFAEWTSSSDEGRPVVRGGSFDEWAKLDPVARVVVRAGAVALPTVGFRLVRDVRR